MPSFGLNIFNSIISHQVNYAFFILLVEIQLFIAVYKPPPNLVTYNNNSHLLMILDSLA